MRVLVDVDNNPATGKFGVDYQKEIQWMDGQWDSFLTEYSSPSHSRILELRRNETVEQDQNYIPLSLYLDSITSPQKFKVLYYAAVFYRNNSKIVVDFTDWLDIPPATYTFSTLPSPLIMRQGERMDVGAQLKSSSGITPNAVGFSPSEKYSGIKLIFNPNKSLNRSSASSTSSNVAPTPFTV